MRAKACPPLTPRWMTAQRATKMMTISGEMTTTTMVQTPLSTTGNRRTPVSNQDNKHLQERRTLTAIERLNIAQTEWRKIFSQTIDDTGSQRVNREIQISVENQRSNQTWGDELLPKGQGMFRVYASNVNGFTLDRRGGQLAQYCTVLQEVQADVACGQEHNLDSIQSPVRSILFETVRQYWQRSRISFSNTPTAFRNLYKPGGTFMISAGNATGRVRTTHHDKWGRWTSQTFQGREGITVTIISAYQVVTDTPGKGLTTAASQQQSFLIQAQDTITSPRVAFRRDIRAYIQQCRREGQEILLMGDFNEHIGINPDGMQKLVDELGLINIMTAYHRTCLPTTYARGHRCLDYAYATPHVVNSVERAGYESFNCRYPTDHRSYFVDFSTEQLFGVQLHPLAKYEPRMLKSNNIYQVTEYIKTKYKYLEAHNVFRRIQELDQPGNRHQFAERIDKDVEAAI